MKLSAARNLGDGGEAHWLLRSLPNVLTMAATSAGLTAVTFAFKGQFPQAIACIMLAALLDACDGRVARYLGTASKFGTELDSLSDVVCFGAVPALVLYLWGMQDAGVIGWLAALSIAVATSLRLARFNVMSQDASRPVWWSAFFVGVPAPAGAFLALFPLYLDYGGLLTATDATRFALVWGPVVALLMTSRIPTFSGKLIGRVIWRGPFVLLALACACAVVIFRLGIWAGFVGMVLAYVSLLPLGAWRFAILSRRG